VFLSFRHGCVDASQHFYYAAPCCDTLHAKSSYRRCGLGYLAERGREASRVWRYWGHLEAIAPARTGYGGWVTCYLVTLPGSRAGFEEAGLNTLASLAKDNDEVDVHLGEGSHITGPRFS